MKYAHSVQVYNYICPPSKWLHALKQGPLERIAILVYISRPRVKQTNKKTYVTKEWLNPKDSLMEISFSWYGLMRYRQPKWGLL